MAGRRKRKGKWCGRKESVKRKGKVSEESKGERETRKWKTK